MNLFFANGIKFVIDHLANRKIVAVARRSKTMSSAAWKSLSKETAIMGQCKGLGGVIQFDFAVMMSKKCYMVMEYCNAGDLNSAMLSKKLRFNENLKVALDSAEGLKNLHSKKIFHRDLYPKNIFLSRKEDQSIQAKIADLGMATIQGEKEDPSSGLFNWFSPWFSPEQAKAKLIKGDKTEKAKQWIRASTDKADLWALGLIFFKMFNPKGTGFSYQDKQSSKESVETRARRIARLSNDQLEKEVAESGIHPEIGQLVLKMLKVSPKERISIEKVHLTLQKIAKKHG